MSKPVFTRLVLKCKFDLDQPFGEIEGINDIPEYQQLQGFQYRELLTARWILSHHTGLPNMALTPIKSELKPGENFRYSGMGYFLLQKILEKQSGMTLEELAQTKLFQPLGMHNTYFYRPNNKTVAVHHNAAMQTSLPKPPHSDKAQLMANAAGSLHTTASDYALLMADWMNDADATMQSAFDFDQAVPLSKDRWAVEKGVSRENLQKLGWGLGWGLL